MLVAETNVLDKSSLDGSIPIKLPRGSSKHFLVAISLAMNHCLASKYKLKEEEACLSVLPYLVSDKGMGPSTLQNRAIVLHTGISRYSNKERKKETTFLATKIGNPKCCKCHS